MVQAGGGDGCLPYGICKLSLESTSWVRLNPLLAYCGGKQRCPVLEVMTLQSGIAGSSMIRCLSVLTPSEERGLTYQANSHISSWPLIIARDVVSSHIPHSIPALYRV